MSRQRAVRPPLRVLFEDGQFILMDDKEIVESKKDELETINIEKVYDVQLPTYCSCGVPHPTDFDMDFCGCRDDY